MKILFFGFGNVSILIGSFLLFAPHCGQAQSLVEARRNFQTELVKRSTRKTPPAMPPPGLFNLVRYKSPVGELSAYVSPDPGKGRKHAAIVWIVGGDCNSIGNVWSPASPANDQTAAAYREAGIIMMFPSLRGGNDNPGSKEGFLGEVDDVLSATRHLASLPYVNPKRIYLGGHSTGGTLALLVAQSSARYRAVFSFGPVGWVASYGENSSLLPFNTKNQQELRLRSPGMWLNEVQSPTWVIEGTEGNLEQLLFMEKRSGNSLTRFVPVKGLNHFNVLAPTNALIAQKIRNDYGANSNFSLESGEIEASHEN